MSMISIPGYKINEAIGRGGMATVYRATQESVGREVAIKIMSPALAADASFSDRFVKEARMANLSHPNIVTVYDAGAVDGTNYIIMEYASGGNLDSKIKQGIRVSESIKVIQQIADALHYSYSKGFIHRDVKPENILFREDGTAVLMDFGIAKAITSGTQLTMVGSTIGSPNYMSPEQARGLTLDGRSDLYSLGIVFYETLTGSKPFDSPDTYVIGLKHINDPVPQLPDVLSLFQPIIDRLLAKTPDERFDNGKKLIEALDALQLDEHIDEIVPQELKNLTIEDSKKETRVKVSHDAETVNVNTYVDQSSDTIADAKTEQITEKTSIANDETQVIDDKTKVIDDKTQIINDKTRVMDGQTRQNTEESKVADVEDDKATDKTRVMTDETRVMPSKESSMIDQELEAGADNTVLMQHDKTRVHPTAETSSSKSGFVGLFIIVLVIGGGIFWYINQPTESPPAEVVKKIEPSDQIKPEVKEEKVVEIKKEPKKAPALAVTKPEISNEERIKELLNKAGQALAKKRYTSPENDNAFKYYSEVLLLENNHSAALAGLNSIAERYLGLAQKRFDNKQDKKAISFVNKGLSVVPDHKELLALRNRIEPKKPLIILKKPPTTDRFESVLLKDLNIHKLNATHIDSSLAIAERFAKQEFVELLYNRMLSQCNSSEKLLDRKECINLYNNFIKHWPLPLKGLNLKSSNISGKQKSTVSFDINDYKQAYTDQIKLLEDNIVKSNASNRKRTLSIANYANYQSLASLFGLTPLKVNLESVDRYLKTLRKNNQVIGSLDALNSFVESFVGETPTYLAPINSENSYEITPYGSSLYESISSLISADQFDAKNSLFMDYALTKSGEVILNMWLFNHENDLIALNSLLLDKALLADKRKTNHLFSTDISPQHRLKSSYGFSSSIAMGNNIRNSAVMVGEATSLKVKLSKPGFYFVAVHVIHGKEQYSYLLPLRQADMPFVQVATRDQTNQYVTLGEFNVSPPTGVEVLQLISSSINLEKYIPDNHWDQKRQQYIIDGSEGDIRKGITEVRNYVNTIPKVSKDKSANWQERIMVTSILDG